VWIGLGLNKNLYWFLIFSEATSIFITFSTVNGEKKLMKMLRGLPCLVVIGSLPSILGVKTENYRTHAT
jgi:hypothetical protein